MSTYYARFRVKGNPQPICDSVSTNAQHLAESVLKAKYGDIQIERIGSSQTQPSWFS